MTYRFALEGKTRMSLRSIRATPGRIPESEGLRQILRPLGADAVVERPARTGDDNAMV